MSWLPKAKGARVIVDLEERWIENRRDADKLRSMAPRVVWVWPCEDGCAPELWDYLLEQILAPMVCLERVSQSSLHIGKPHAGSSNPCIGAGCNYCPHTEVQAMSNEKVDGLAADVDGLRREVSELNTACADVKRERSELGQTGKRMAHFETVVNNLQARVEDSAPNKHGRRLTALEQAIGKHRTGCGGYNVETQFAEIDKFQYAQTKRIEELEASLGMLRREVKQNDKECADLQSRVHKLENPEKPPQPMDAAPLRCMPLHPWMQLLADMHAAIEHEIRAHRDEDDMQQLGEGEWKRLQARVGVALEALDRESFRQQPPAFVVENERLAQVDREERARPEGIAITFDSERQPVITIHDVWPMKNLPSILELAQFLRQTRALVMVDAGGPGKGVLDALLSHNVNAIPLPKVPRG